MPQKRESWDEYFARMAQAVASRSTCLRLKVGAVLVQNNSVRGTGYNGAPSGVLSCEDLGQCLLRHNRCIRSVHAEANLILQTDTKDRLGATVYVTAMPCWSCSLLLVNSGVSEVVYLDSYGLENEETEKLFLEAGVRLRQIALAQKEADS